MRRLLKMAGGGSAAFSPDDISGLKFWAEANMTGVDLTLNGSNVINWGDADLTQVTQVTDSKRPVLGSSPDSVTYDGVDDLSSAASLVLSSAMSGYMVFQAAGAVDIPLEHSVNATSNPGFQMLTFSSSVRLTLRRGSSISAISFADGLDGDYHLLSWHHGGTHASWEVYVNGVSQSLSDVTVNDVGVSNATDTLFLGARSGGSFPFAGPMQSVLLYDGVHSAGDRGDITTYLNDGVF